MRFRRKIVGIGQTDISQRVARIRLNCLPKIANAFFKTIGRSLVPKITSLQIKLISCRVYSVALHEPAFFFTRQSQLQFPGHFAGDRLFDGQRIGEFTVVALAPQLGAVRRVDQVNLNTECVLHLPDPPAHDRPYP